MVFRLKAGRTALPSLRRQNHGKIGSRQRLRRWQQKASGKQASEGLICGPEKPRFNFQVAKREIGLAEKCVAMVNAGAIFGFHSNRLLRRGRLWDWICICIDEAHTAGPRDGGGRLAHDPRHLPDSVRQAQEDKVRGPYPQNPLTGAPASQISPRELQDHRHHLLWCGVKHAGLRQPLTLDTLVSNSNVMRLVSLPNALALSWHY